MDRRAGPGLSAAGGFLIAAFSLLLALLGFWWYEDQAPDVEIIELEFAGSAAEARDVVGQAAGEFQAAITADWALIVAYGLALLAACGLGVVVFRTRRGRIAALIGLGASGVVVAADVLENVLLTVGLSRLGTPGTDPLTDSLFAVAAAAAAVKFSMLVPATLVAVTAAVVTLRRAVGGWRRRRRLPASPQRPVATVPPPPVMTSSRHTWDAGAAPDGEGAAPPATRWDAGRVRLPGRTSAAVGFCVSGGGIRSACVTLGALDALRSELLQARYLVSVSGGGYAAGALQLALQPQTTGSASAASPDDVLRAGSVELDHVRRHGNYIAEGAWQWAVALFTVLRGVVVSLAVLGAAVVTAGIALNAFYAKVHLFDPVLLDPASLITKPDKGPEELPLSDVLSPPALWVVGVALGLALVVWLVGLVFTTERLRPTGRYLVLGALGVAAAVGVFAVLVPAIVWSVVVGLPAITGLPDELDPAQGVGAGLGTIVVTYAGALVGILWRQRKGIGGVMGLLPKRSAGKTGRDTFPRRVANGLVQYAIVWGVLVVLALLGLFLLGWTTVLATDWHLGWKLGLPAALAVIAFGVDETWASLHPFYRRRLASAFAVRRVTRDDGWTVAQPYDFDSETTSLSTYGQPPRDGDARFPQVIFACAANLSGQERTPPGRRAASYTMSHDYIGSPDLGYASTPDTEDLCPRRLQMDLTVQSAVAVSGAAFASAMGGQARTIQTLLALSNARLGTWLPNPAVLSAREADAGWRTPGLPSVRRPSYHLREILGQFPFDQRLLYVTDGGHYENLGLVELLRHGCKTIYCIDGTGDSPPFATTLAQAITLAYEELGVEITLNNAHDAIPGSGEPLRPEGVLEELNARLSASEVVTGTIHYPKEIEFDDDTTGRTGRLYLAKALLTPQTPYELLSYAASHDEFPNDGTGDQWFDHAQFNAYFSLGRHIGHAAKSTARMDREQGWRRRLMNLLG